MRSSSARTSLARVAAHLFLLSSVALGLPLFDVLSVDETFFVAHRSEPADIWMFAAIPCVLVPIALLAIIALGRAVSAGVGDVLARVLLSCLVALYVVRLLNGLAEPSAIVVLCVAFLASGAFGWLYGSSSGLRLFLTVLSPAALAVPLLFLLHSPVSELAVALERPLPREAARLERTPPIVIVVLDELPLLSLLNAQGEIDGYRFPNFARLASISAWFRSASTVSDSTPGAITAIATGRYQKKRDGPDWNQQRENLFTLLRGYYELNVWETMTRLVPPSLHNARAAVSAHPFAQRMTQLLADASVVYAHLVVPVDLRGHLPMLDGAWRDLARVEPPGLLRRHAGWREELLGTDRGAVVREFISTIRADDPPTLHFLHTMLPHTPWVHLPSGKWHDQVRIPGVGLRQNKRARAAWKSGPESRMRRWHQRHLLQVAYVDSLIGDLLDHLEREAMLDEVLLVVTSDHGRAFIVGDEHRVPNPSNLAEVLFVPLFIKPPSSRAGAKSQAHAQVVDIVPSIADLLGAEIPWEIDGLTLFGSDERPTRRRIFSRASKRQFYRDDVARALLRDALIRNISRFSLDRPGHGLYAFGPFMDAIGEETASFARIDADLTVNLEQPEAVLSVDLDALVLPALVVGHVTPEPIDAAALGLAISVNGTIEAVADLELEGARFEAILPEASLRSGKNLIAIHLIQREADGALQLLGPARIVAVR